MVLGQRRDLLVAQNQHLGIGHNHSVISGQGYDLGLGKTDDHDLGVVDADDHELVLGQAHDQKMVLRHSNGHSNEHESRYEQSHDNGINRGNGDNSSSNEDDTELDTLDHQMDLASQNHEFGLLENNNQLAVIDSNEMDDKLELSQDMSIVAAPDMTVDQGHLVTTPVIQSRTLVPAPTHELTVGQEFSDVKSCRRALRDTAIALHFEIQTVKSDKTRFTAKCASEGCPWRIHAAKLPGVPTFTIRTIHNQHTCGGITHLGHQQASVQWVASSVEQSLRENPHYKPKEILEEIHRVHGITLSYKQAWRGKERIMAVVRGSFEEDYRILPQYCNQIILTNPGSIASVYVDPADNCFQRLFISFQASIYGFLNACRPLIGLDRTVLKSKYLGTLLFATGFDGDGSLFPLVFGVVDEENDDNWMWFLSELHNLLENNTENMPRLTILSDRQKGVVEGVEANFPTAFHGFCLHHLSESFRKEFNNSMLINLLWEAANALTVIDFEAKVLEIEDVSQEAAYWIRRVPPRLWATAYFEGTRFGNLTANIVESLNSWILEASALPIIQMMESIRRQLMTWFNERREASMQWASILVPSAERRVSEALERARTYQVLYTSWWFFITP